MQEETNDDSFYENHLLKVCAAIGGEQNGEFVPGDEAIECLRDLKRFLRADEQHERRDTHKLLGKWNVVPAQLIPLLLTAVKIGKIKLALATLLVPLTWPLKPNSLPEELENIQKYKQSFLVKGTWAAILAVIVQLISVPFSKRSPNEHARLRLLLCLVRNILAVPDPQDVLMSSNEQFWKSSTQEELVKLMKEEQMMDFLLSLAASSSDLEYRPWNTIVLEIFFHIFFARSPSELLHHRKVAPEQQQQLQSLLQKEKAQKKRFGSRHARFGGTYSLETANGSQIHVRKAPVGQNVDFDHGKSALKPRMKLQGDFYAEKPFLFSESATIFDGIASSFLENCFNELMPSVKREMDVEATQIQEFDYLYFFYVLGFFIDYYIAKSTVLLDLKQDDSEFDQLSRIIIDSTIIFFLKRLQLYHDEKNQRYLYFTLKSLESFLGLLRRLAKHESEDIKKVSMQIQSKMFYEEINLFLLVHLIKEPQLRSIKFLECLVSIVDLIFVLIEENWGTTGGVVTRRVTHADPDGFGGGADSESEGETNQTQYYRERILTVDRFEKMFAFENAIETLCFLLQNFESMKPKTLNQIVNIFKKIRDKDHSDKESLFYQASFLYLFNTISNSPLYKTPMFKELKEFIDGISNSLCERMRESPIIAIDLFFTKTRSDCVRIQYGDIEDDYEPEEEDLPSATDLAKDYGVPSKDKAAHDIQIRNLGKIVSKLSHGKEFLRWLSRTLRQVLFEDYEDIVREDLVIDNCLTILPFVLHSEAPFFVEEFIKKEIPELFLRLIGFASFGEGDWIFPLEIDHHLLELIEGLNEVKVYQQTTISKAQFTKKRTRTRNSDDAEPRVLKEKPEKPAPIYKSEQFVVDSDDDADDEEFFAREAALRARLNEQGGVLQQKRKEPTTSNQHEEARPQKKVAEEEASSDSEATIASPALSAVSLPKAVKALPDVIEEEQEEIAKISSQKKSRIIESSDED